MAKKPTPRKRAWDRKWLPQERSRRAERRKAINAMVGDTCPTCGGQMIIPQFHHPDNNKEHDVGDMYNFKLERMLHEINKCEVMCRSCHNKLHPNVKLTELDVEDIRNLALLGFSQVELSKIFKVCFQHISAIVNRKRRR